MSKVLRVNEGNYRIIVESGNNITLDTGLSGTVYINGNLDIQGQTTTIESVNATVKDNVIVLNSGEPGLSGISSRTENGVASRTSGILIDRGQINSLVSSASLLFDEEALHYNTATTTYDSGTFVLSTKSDSIVSVASMKLYGVEVKSVSSNGSDSIQFNLHNTDTYLSLVNSTYGSTTYEDRLIAGNSDANHATNNSLTTKKYVNTYVVSGKLTAGMADVDKIYYKDFVNNIMKSEILATSTSQLQFTINDSQRAVITATGLSVDTLNLFGTTLKNTGSNPLILQSDISLVEINSVLALDDQSSTPAISSGKTKIYSIATAGPGKSGLFFRNNTTSDELVATNRALLFSMLF
jgi:hypothetical protein